MLPGSIRMSSEIAIIKVLQNYFEIPSSGLIESNIKIIDVKTGLIHNSYRVQTHEGEWLLQRINTEVFRDLDGLMHNVVIVTEKLTEVYRGSNYETLELKKTLSGANYVQENGSAWRLYGFKSHLRGYNAPLNQHMVKEAGKAFANFTAALANLNPNQLVETIPKFHSLKSRYEQFLQSKLNPKVQTEDLKGIFNDVEQYFEKLSVLEDAMNSGGVPVRITHNDSKFNNLLFDSDGHARCVVDLDTVMPGIIHFDVGDCLRTLVPNIPEDSPDLHILELNSSFENAFLEGYLEEAKNWITAQELEYLSFSGPYMALIMGIRFLTDYLNGNVYFTCEYPTQNLIRARNQIALVGQWEVGSRK